MKPAENVERNQEPTNI